MALQVLDLGKIRHRLPELRRRASAGLIGGLAAFTLIGRPTTGVGLPAWDWLLVGLPLAILALVPHTAPALVLLGVVGLGTTVVDAAGLTLLQRVVPDGSPTRVMESSRAVFVRTLRARCNPRTGADSWDRDDLGRSR